MANGVDAAVADQYRQYPYPPRDPEDERRRLTATWLGHLPRIAGLFWGGGHAAPRVLDAGCGTGDATIYLAHQGARVVALDASEASLAVARRRAEVRGLRAITFVRASILDVPRLALGRFDYVLCSGVLHHLADPAVALAALVEAMEDDAGLGLMLYGRFGREPVYAVQDLVRRLAGEAPLDERIAVARETLAALPARHFFKLGQFERELLDIEAGPSGVADLLCHPRDRAYTVPDIHSLLASAGLTLLAFEPPVLYRPESYPLSPGLLARVQRLDEPERQAVAELLNGRMTTHKLYATRKGVTPETPNPRSAAHLVRPVMYEAAIATYFSSLPDTPQPFNLESPFGFSINLTFSRADVALLRGVGERASLHEVITEAGRALGRAGIAETEDTLRARWDVLYDALATCGYAGYAWAAR